MSKIDLDKFICSMIEAFPDFKESGRIPCMYKQALADQGLEYMDGKIVEILEKHGDNWQIDAGKWYMCIKDGVFGGFPDGDTHFHQGEVYRADDKGIIDHHNNNFHEDFKFEPEGTLYKYFRPATDEEIPHNPKFKVGDWIVMVNSATDKEETTQVVKFEKGTYYFSNGCSKNIGERKMRLWTVALYAKDGDVLAHDVYKGERPPFVMIFKEQRNSEYNPVKSYCYIAAGKSKFLVLGDHVDTGLYPATQEQRQLLFDKMKEAGYEWSAEKKELREINSPVLSNSPNTEELTEFEKALGEAIYFFVVRGNFNHPKLKEQAQKLLFLARKQIVSEIINKIDTREMERQWNRSKEDGACFCRDYFWGMEAVINILKGEIKQ